MLCQIHRSNSKPGTYLYLSNDMSFDELPCELIQLLGQCQMVMQLNLAGRDRLATENIEIVKKNLTEQGYHLQIPPKITKNVINYGV